MGKRIMAYASALGSMIPRSRAKGLKAKGRPRCPCCGQPLNIIYEGASSQVGEKCGKCGAVSIVDADLLVAYQVVDDWEGEGSG